MARSKLFPPFDPGAIRQVAVDVLSAAIFDGLRTLTPSRALRDMMYLDVRKYVAEVVYPHFWARFLHDGRGPIKVRFKKFLVYYTDPELDPRIAPTPYGYPVKKRQQKRLNAEQFKVALKMFREDLAAGRKPRAVITRGPTGLFEGHKWMESAAMKRLTARASEDASRAVAFQLDRALRHGERDVAKL